MSRANNQPTPRADARSFVAFEATAGVVDLEGALWREASASPSASGTAAFAAVVSFVVHIVLATLVTLAAPESTRRSLSPVAVRIVSREKPPALPASLPEELTPPPAPKPKPKPKPKEVSSERRAKAKPEAPVQPIQGFSPESLTIDGPGIAVPAGNTLMVEDQGIRAKPEDVQSLGDADMSADAVLLASSVVVPKYTDDAVSAGVEAFVAVDVFVDAQGDVTDVEMKKRLGFGMDERILASARVAKFQPRRDRYGRPVPGWTVLRFRLEIPN